jgi:hypothetical protein
MTAKAKMKRSCTGFLVPKALVVTVLLISNTTTMMAVPVRKSWEKPVKTSKLVIGLLQLPSIFLPEESDLAADAALPVDRQPIRAYAKRSAQSTIVAIIQGPEDIETLDDPYKRPGAVVYDVLNSWYLIGVKSYGQKLKGWVYVKNSNAFITLGWLMLLADNAGYVNTDWDGELWTTPGDRSKVRLLTKLATRDFTVVGTKGHFDGLWLQVEFSEHVSCDWKELPPVVAEGWIPAYNKSGKLQFWYYPRLDC